MEFKDWVDSFEDWLMFISLCLLIGIFIFLEIVKFIDKINDRFNLH